jgi:DNA-binding NarL/FixJ family response regulator
LNKKKEHYYFDMTKETYNYVTNGILLKESKKEKTILDMCIEGKTIKEISNKTGYSTSTISNRKREIYKKIMNFF